MTEPTVNVARRLAEFARTQPHAVAVAAARLTGYATTTFAQLEADSDRIARGFRAWGVPTGARSTLR